MALMVTLKILGLMLEMFGTECIVQNCAKNWLFWSLDRRVATGFSESRFSKATWRVRATEDLGVL